MPRVLVLTLAGGLTPGHAYTVRVGNFVTDNDGGRGAGGVVGGSGSLTAAGNHCVHQLDPSDPSGSTGGFEPGTPPNCDLIEADGAIAFFLIDHDEWTPGDQSARQTPLGGGFAGVMSAFFPAPAP